MSLDSGSFWLGFSIGAVCIMVCVIVALMKVWREEHERRLKLEVIQDPKPVCGCRHHRSFHNDDGCNYTTQDYHTEIKCGCTVYIGPPALELME